MTLSKELLRTRINEDYVKTFIHKLPSEAKKKAIMILGHGRSGKDTLAEYLVSTHGYNFSGTSSKVLCNTIYPESPELMYVRRHEFKQELFEFGNVIRDLDPRYIPWASLEGSSDLLVGLRSSIDISAALDTCVDVCIWVHSDVETDPTMDYDLSWLMSACMHGHRTIGRADYVNKKSIREMYEQIYGGGSYDSREWVSMTARHVQSIGHSKIPLYFLNNVKDDRGRGLEYLGFQADEFVYYSRLLKNNDTRRTQEIG